MTDKTDTTIMTLATELQRLQTAYDEMRSAGEWHRRRNRRKRAEEARRAAEKGWDEGFDAGERDVLDHNATPDGWDKPCIANPYRKSPLVERVKENNQK